MHVALSCAPLPVFLCINDEIHLLGDFDGDGTDDLAVFRRHAEEDSPQRLREDVIVVISEGKPTCRFSKQEKWNEYFCLGDEVPNTFAAVFPYLVFTCCHDKDYILDQLHMVFE